MSGGIQPPIQIAAAGVCPQNLAAGRAAPNVIGATAISGGNGVWLVTAKDPTILPDGSWALIAFPGNGSNLPEGVSFGQSQAQTVNGFTLFSYSTYRNDTGAALDVESRFVIVKWPGTSAPDID